ncbi:MAG: Ig-like domain-containing protein [Lachnospiraceae bacterium]|nr:Ig-like domain-containing protein [Lachnospiraceae bacterium]
MKYLVKIVVVISYMFITILCLDINTFATEEVELNTDYYFKDSANKASDGFVDDIVVSVPNDGRIRLVIEDCTENYFGGECLFGISSDFFGNQIKVMEKEWNKNTEGVSSNWISVDKETYRFRMDIYKNPNKEAKYRIEYQVKGTYLGEDESNDTYDDANIILPEKIYYGDYSKVADVDIYKFTIAKPSKVEIFAKNVLDSTESVAYTLYEEDINGNVYEIDKVYEDRTFRLPKGDYYIKINCTRNYEQYELKVIAKNEALNSFEKENNNIKKQANLKNCNKWYTGNMNTSYDIDYYKISVPKRSYLSLKFKISRGEPDGCIKISLYDKNLNLICEAENTSNPYLETEKVLMNKGTYYVRVERGSSYNYWLNTDYKFYLKQQEYVKLSKEEAVLKKGKTMQLKLKGATGSIKWKSSKRAIATVNSKGVIKAKKSGAAKITAVYKGKKYSCKVIVVEATAKEVKKAYKKYAAKNLKESDYPYRNIFYYDIDKDNIDEMIVSYEAGNRMAYQLYTYYKGKTRKLHKEDFAWCSGIYSVTTNPKYICIQQTGGADNYYLTVYKISNKKLKEVVNYSYDDYTGEAYKNGKEISISELNDFLNTLE